MSKRSRGAVEKLPENTKAKEILQSFFDDVQKIEGMDVSVASIIKGLWNDNRLGSEELLAALKNERSKGDKNAKKED